MRFVAAVVVLASLALCASSAGARPAGRLDGYGISLTLPRVWHGLAAPGELQAADFPLPRGVLGSAQRARVPRGHVHLIVWDYGPTVPYLAANFQPVRPPLALSRRHLSGGPLEGFPASHVYAGRSVAIGGELLEVIADLGPKPLAANSFTKANRVLATLRVQSPRIVYAHNNRLAADGVALRLLPGWSGRIEIPADQHAAQLVVRASRGSVHLVLVQMVGGQGAHADLPITVTAKNVFHHRGLAIARRVFSTAGRSFDLSVIIHSLRGLARANRLLKTLTAAPRPWTFRSCDLRLRLPGTWRAAINPRSGCYPVITLHGPGLRVVLTELRPTEPARGRVLLRSGRRFQVDVTPRSATHTAETVLASLHAKRR